MSMIIDDPAPRIANRIRVEREQRSWSLADLSERSGVSRAMISKIERNEASPTATVLGRLSGAFGLTLSTLLARAECAVRRIARAAEQLRWQDPETGHVRLSISPPGSKVIELVRSVLPPGARLTYPAAAYAFIDQQILVLKGCLTFTEGAAVHKLREGDCLELGPPSDCIFENRTRSSCEYLVAIARH
jgi:transcriptional regulator with XRE-family HTH domain